MSIINDIIVENVVIKDEFKNNIIIKLSRKQAGEGGDRKFFNQYWQPFVWATIIGFKNEKRVEITGKTSPDTFKYSVINNQAPNILKSLILMAISKFEIKDEAKEIKKLQDGKEIKVIIEEYANGGFEIISRKLNENPDYFYDHNVFITDLLNK